MKYQYEDSLNDGIADFLRSRCIRYSWQIPILDSRIDFMGVTGSYKVIGVEAKISDWKKAISQAQRYQLCVDLSYVALPMKLAIRIKGKYAHFFESGIGLIGVGVDTEILIKAKRTDFTIAGLRGYLLMKSRRRRKLAEKRIRLRIASSKSLEDKKKSDSYHSIDTLRKSELMISE